jgi:heme o synthase
MSRYQSLAITSGILVFIVMLLDGLVRIAGDTIGCRDGWYFCTPSPTPLVAWIAVLEFGQRAAVAAFLVALALLLAQGRRLLSFDSNLSLFLLPLAAAVLTGGYGVLLVAGGGAELVLSRILLAQILFALLVTAALVAAVRNAGIQARSRGGSGLDRLAGATAVAVLGLIVAGSAIALGDSTTIACGAWPLCDGQLIPTGFSAVDLHLTHRWIALFATIGVLLAIHWSRRAHRGTPALRGLSNAAAALMITQIFIGAATVWTEQNPITSVAHLGVAGVIWGVLVAIVVLDRLLPATTTMPAVRPVVRQIFADYLALTKPRIMVLLLITTLGAMLIAAAGFPSFGLIFWTMLGGALSAGGASALNHYLDRDIDGLMSRTRRRPVPGGRVAPVQVAIFGVTLSVLAVYVLIVFVNPLAAMLALAGNLFYVVIYTRYLKRATPQNIVIGGAAGAVPPLVGWAAVTNSVGVPALILFAIIFYWTPPHFWALALFKSGDYQNARVPMFPAIYGEAETRRHILLYTVMLVIVSIFPFALQVMGPFYLVSALILGGGFLLRAIQLSRHPSDLAARKVFFFSLWYLALIFLVMVIDRMVWFG